MQWAKKSDENNEIVVKPVFLMVGTNKIFSAVLEGGNDDAIKVLFIDSNIKMTK